MRSETRAIALTGTIGAGKTTLAEAISEELHGRGIRHALLDLDWLGQVYPVPEGHDPYDYELALQNLRDIWPNFEAAGAHRAVIAGTLLNRAHRDRLQDALGLPMTVILVKAPKNVTKERIRQRDNGRLLEDFLARTHQVAVSIEAAGMHDLEVMNHERASAELARSLLRTMGWV